MEDYEHNTGKEKDNNSYKVAVETAEEARARAALMTDKASVEINKYKNILIDALSTMLTGKRWSG